MSRKIFTGVSMTIKKTILNDPQLIFCTSKKLCMDQLFYSDFFIFFCRNFNIIINYLEFFQNQRIHNNLYVSTAYYQIFVICPIIKVKYKKENQSLRLKTKLSEIMLNSFYLIKIFLQQRPISNDSNNIISTQNKFPIFRRAFSFSIQLNTRRIPCRSLNSGSNSIECCYIVGNKMFF